MHQLTRRAVLRCTGAAVVGSTAGCLGRSEPGTEPDDGGDSDDETTDENDGNGTDGEDDDERELVDYDVIQYATTGSRPDWFEDVGETVGSVVVIDSEERAHVVWPHDEVHPDRREEVADFFRETSFQDSVLLFVESAGPNACHDAIEIEDVALDGDALTATASVAETSEGDVACAQAVTHPSAIVRASFSGDPATDASITIVDGWGNEATVNASADDPLSPDPDDLPGHVRPDGDPEQIPGALDCADDGVERLRNWVDEDDIAWGATTNEDGVPSLALRVDRLAIERGDAVTIAMTNVTDEPQSTGNRHKYSLEVYTEEGWQDVRVGPAEQPLAYTDEAVIHDPGEGFRWEFEFTEAGIVEGHVHEDALDVCPALPTGRYRFVFWEPALAVAFDVTA